MVEETTEVLGERILQYWRIRVMSKWNMNDKMSKGKHNNNRWHQSAQCNIRPNSRITYNVHVTVEELSEWWRKPLLVGNTKLRSTGQSKSWKRLSTPFSINLLCRRRWSAYNRGTRVTIKGVNSCKKKKGRRAVNLCAREITVVTDY